MKKRKPNSYVVAPLTTLDSVVPITPYYGTGNNVAVSVDPYDAVRKLKDRGHSSTTGRYIVMIPVCVIVDPKSDKNLTQTWELDYIPYRQRSRPRRTKVPDVDEFAKYIVKVRDDDYNKRLLRRNLKDTFGPDPK